MDDDNNFEETDYTHEIENTVKELKCKNVELRQTVSYLKKENISYKRRYDELKQKLLKLNESLEKNAQTFYELFDDTKSSLQMGLSMLNSPIKHKELRIPKTVSHIKPGPSGVKRLPIERLNMKELCSQIGETLIEKSPNLNKSGNQSSKENSIPSPENDAKKLCVYLQRLPQDVIKKHLQESNTVASKMDCTDNLTDISLSTSLHPDFSSTPLKIETMKRLGLIPTPLKHTLNSQFVNVRKRLHENIVLSPENKTKSSSPIKHEKNSKLKRNSNEGFITKRNKSKISPVQSDVSTNSNGSGRPLRKAKPKFLQEQSLKKKLRR